MFNLKHKKILKEVLSGIKPSVKELKSLSELSNNVISQIKKQGYVAKVGGSLAKDTLINKKNPDVDIFVIFDSEEETKDLEKVLKKVKTKGKLQKVHGSRDYFKIVFPDAVLEIIPTVKISSPAKARNITDISILHVDYLRKKIKRNKRLCDEIRLAKVFCSAADCYGAESYIQGFSGYALEILIVHFGSLLNFLKKIEKNKVIDPEKQFRNKREIKREINASKLLSPVILVDPTYKYRNVTAALSQETFEKFLKYAKDFLKNPTKEHFKNKVINKKELQDYAVKTGANYFEIKISTKKQEGDIAGTKMKKFFNFFLRALADKGQEVLMSEFDYNGTGQRANGYLVLKENKRIEVRGPELTRKQESAKFRKARKEVFERKGFIWAMETVSISKIFNKTKRQQGEMEVKAEMKIN